MFRIPGSKPGRGRRILQNLSGGGGSVAATGAIVPPQGRLTVASMTPVLTATDSGNTTVYYTPYCGEQVPVYDGSDWEMLTFAEMSQATTDATKSPAAVAADSNYDMFVWEDSSTMRCTRGPAWTSATGRGTGAGTTQLTMINGILVNTVAITNGPGANRGTYVGTIRTNGSSRVDFILGAIAAGGTAGVIGIWNAYNRVDVAMLVQDNTDTWNYSTATWRSANASDAMRVSFVLGLQEDAFSAEYMVASSNNDSAAVGLVIRGCALGYDATNAVAAGCSPGRADLCDVNVSSLASVATVVNPKVQMHARFAKLNALGFHFVQAIEAATAGGTTTWYGDNGGGGGSEGAIAPMQNGLFFRGRY